MSKFDTIGDKYKSLEKEYRNQFEKDKFIILRLDGKSFHTFTKGMKKPFDDRLHTVFSETLKYLCENIDLVKIGYYQSDEISLVLYNDSEKENKEYWFDNKVEKILTIATSICTAKFNEEYRNLGKFGRKDFGFFDARGFIVNNWNEVIEYLIWRVNDSIKNSVYLYSYEALKNKGYNPTKILLNKSVKDKIELLQKDFNINYYDFDCKYRKGIFYIKEFVTFIVKKENYPKYMKEDKVVTRRKFVLYNDFESVDELINKVKKTNDKKI